MNSKQNFVVFSAATDSEHFFFSNTTQKRTKQNLVSVFIVKTGARNLTLSYKMGFSFSINCKALDPSCQTGLDL